MLDFQYYFEFQNHYAKIKRKKNLLENKKMQKEN